MLLEKVEPFYLTVDKNPKTFSAIPSNDIIAC